MTRKEKLAKFEAALRAAEVPYIVVDEAKKALFGKAKLASFDFIVYTDEAPNLLVRVGRATAESRKLMGEWQTAFGDGFVAAFAEAKEHGWRFKGLKGPIADPFDRPGETADRPDPETPIARRTERPRPKESRATCEVGRLTFDPQALLFE